MAERKKKKKKNEAEISTRAFPLESPSNYVHAALESNGYPSKFIRNIHVKRTRSSTTNVSPEELVGMFFKMVEPTESRKSFASLPYIKGVIEPLTRVLKKQDVTVLNKPFTTLQQQFPAPKFRPSMESQTNVVYKIPCTNCLWCYIGETGRALASYADVLRLVTRSSPRTKTAVRAVESS